MKVSVAMPAFNASRYIKDMIESVLTQDFNDFELVMLDDGSTDDTFSIMQLYKKNRKVRIYRNLQNLGVGASRNRLVGLARGRYICPCDADDIMLPGNLRTQSGFLDKNPRFGAVYGDMLVLERSAGKRGDIPPRVMTADKGSGWDLLDNTVFHPGSLIRKDLILRVGGYDEEVYAVDDWDLWLKLVEITKIGHLKGQVLYGWERHGKSLTRTDKRRGQDVKKIRWAAIKRRYGYVL